MRKRLALLSLLLVVSIGSAVLASACGVLRFLANEGEVKIIEIFSKLTLDQRGKAVKIA